MTTLPSKYLYAMICDGTTMVVLRESWEKFGIGEEGPCSWWHPMWYQYTSGYYAPEEELWVQGLDACHTSLVSSGCEWSDEVLSLMYEHGCAGEPARPSDKDKPPG